jgi:hypothetical protein
LLVSARDSLREFVPQTANAPVFFDGAPAFPLDSEALLRDQLSQFADVLAALETEAFG